MDEKILGKLQKTEFGILKDVAKLIDENGLDYFLIAGTLLGAAKYKGFIPWDDDIDIAMPRADYNRFIEICMENLDEKYYLHCTRTDEQFWLSFAKIRLNNTIFNEEAVANINSHKGIYIDIFPLDNANKQTSFMQRVQSYLKRGLTVIILSRRGICTEYNKKRKAALAIFLTRFLSFGSLNKIQQRIMAWNKNSESKYFVNLGSHHNHIKHAIHKGKYYPIRAIEFEGEKFNAPNDYDFILRKVYGNYFEDPLEEDRLTHNTINIDFGSY